MLKMLMIFISSAAMSKTLDTQRTVPKELIIKVNSSFKTSDPTVKRLHRKMKAKARSPFKIFTQFQVVTLPKEITTQQALKFYNAQKEVAFAEPHYKVRAFQNKRPQDILFEEQWALENTGQRGGVPGSDTDALKAWEVYQPKKEIIVAVIDTGADYEHPDLIDNMWKNTDEIPRNGIDDDGNGYVDDVHGYNFYDDIPDPMDDNMHGTHCSGIIAAAHNKIGIRGIAPNAKIMPVKFLGAWGDGELEDGIQAIEYAMINGAHIMSNSWGGPPYSQTLDEVIQRVQQKGILFVAAAGNDHSNNDTEPTYPASYLSSNVLSVAASNPKDTVATFTNWGPRSVHIAAPGRHILSTIPDEGYKTASGTSMAAPYVSGAAAVVWSHFPEMDYLDVKNRLIQTVDRQYIFEEQVLAGGRLNLYNALTNIQFPPLPPDTSWTEIPYELSSPHDYPNMANLKWTIHHPGAKVMRIHFKKFETEKRMDYVGLKDFQSITRETLTGLQGTLWSRPIIGDTIHLELRSDSINELFGFEIDKIQVK